VTNLSHMYIDTAVKRKGYEHWLQRNGIRDGPTTIFL
jgi:hypothetical protein